MEELEISEFRLASEEPITEAASVDDKTKKLAAEVFQAKWNGYHVAQKLVILVNLWGIVWQLSAPFTLKE